MSLSKKRVLAEIKHLVEIGVSCHWLHPNRKNPVMNGWQEKPFFDLETLDDLHVTNANIGFRPGEYSETAQGFVHVIDFDIRDEAQFHEAQAVLQSIFPEYEAHPMVQSGSGGSSRHIWFVTDKPFSTKKLAKSEGFSMVWDEHKGREVKKYDWEIDLLGSRKNCVIPPSIHPDTGKEYVWLNPFDTAALEDGDGPFIPHEKVESWGGQLDHGGGGGCGDDDDDLMAVVRNEPLGFSDAEMAAILADLPEDWLEDRDGWRTVGSALHHETRGGENGFKLWCDWSEQEEEKFDKKDQLRVWKSFGEKPRPVRLPTLIQAAKQHRLERDLFGIGEDEDEGEDTFAAPVPAPKQTPQQAIDELLGYSEEEDLDLSGDDDDLNFLENVEKATDIERIARAMPPTHWLSELAQTDDGAVKSTLTNVSTIVRNDPRSQGVLAYNEFINRIVRVKQPGLFKRRTRGTKPLMQMDPQIFEHTGDPNGDEWGDTHTNMLREAFEASQGQGGYGFKVTDRDLNAAIDLNAHKNRFHPIRDFLNDIAEKWDGQERLAHLLRDYLYCADTPYHREVSTLMLVACVARIFQPGIKFDQIPVLEGPQGIGKSTFCKVLAHGWFGEITVDQFRDKKEAVEAMQGKLILEIPELSGLNRADMGIVKFFTATAIDRVRLSYERNAKDYARQSIMIGTTNETDYLVDPTGNRRFWPIRGTCDKAINISRLRVNLDQLWAEAVHVYRRMEAEKTDKEIMLDLYSDAAKDEAKALQTSRRIISEYDILAASIMEWLDDPVDEFDDLEGGSTKYRMYVSSGQIWTECLGRSISETGRGSVGRTISKAMGLVPGWRRSEFRVKVGGRKHAIECFERAPDNHLFNHLHPNAALELLTESRTLMNGGVVEVPPLPKASPAKGELDLLA